MLTILYFAWVREMIGLDEERIERPSPDTTVADLIDALADRGGGYAEALADRARVRVAMDQTFVSLDMPVGEARELAIFPPVTGG
ncbi:molybdopterin converting factor subunit 1 [Sphingobium aromaticiconvertens]|uniref:molybdopterin converting factor subunit 1 n=1 Tax=Sphingobium aromaticiconvertens TaxID=365341 RepID=UPI00301ADC40